MVVKEMLVPVTKPLHVHQTILLQMMNANFLYEVLTSTPKQIYLVEVQCKAQNTMHDDKKMFLDFLKIKEIQKEKE